MLLSLLRLTRLRSGDLIITPAARARLADILAEGECLRVEVQGGGCSGFEYKLSIDKEKKEDDLEEEVNGRSVVVVDKDSLEYIKGATLDFQQDLMRSSFRIHANPLAGEGCSCGSSFSLKGS